MHNIPWQRWAITCLILLALGLAADFFFLHFLFEQKRLTPPTENSAVSGVTAPLSATSNADSKPAADKVADAAATAPPPEENAPSVDNFLQTLKECRSDISAQGIATPEALVAYLEKSIGKIEESKDVENFHIILPNGSERRLHLIPAANNNSNRRMELRYFRIDAEGYPERIPLKEEQTYDPDQVFIDSLLSQGRLKLHQVKSSIQLKDGGTLILETHNDKVYEFQLREADKTLSCRRLSCQCR